VKEPLRAAAPSDEHPKQKDLELEFGSLKRTLRLDDGLRLRWMPAANGGGLSGEVRGNTVFIYDPDYEAASSTLRHELIDYLVSRAIEPYKEVANKLILLLNERAYRNKEDVVERLCALLAAPPPRPATHETQPTF